MIVKNCIETLTFDTSFPNEETAFLYQNDFEEFIKSTVLSMIEEIFEDYSEKDDVLWFELIEIDLGEISLAYFYDDYANKLDRQLRSCFDDEIPQIEVSPNSANRRIKKKGAELEIILDYLKNGYLPWNALVKDANGLEKLFKKVLKENPDGLIKYLAGSTSRIKEVHRVAKQLPQEIICEVALQLLSQQAGLITIVDELCVLSESSFGLRSSELRRLMWVDLVLFALSQNVKSADPHKIIMVLTKSIASALPQNQALVLRQLIQQIKTKTGKNQLYQLLREASFKVQGRISVDTGWNSTTRSLSPGKDSGLQEREVEHSLHISELRRTLVWSLKTGESDQLKPIWLSLLGDGRELLRDTILSLGKSAHIRYIISQKFETAMVRDIAELLEPASTDFIEEVVLFFDSSGLSDLNIFEGKGGIEKKIWEFSITYLIIEHRSVFSRKAFLSSVMWQLAAQIGVSTADLYSMIIKRIRQDKRLVPLQSDLVDLFIKLNSGLSQEIPVEGREYVSSNLNSAAIQSDEKSEDEFLDGLTNKTFEPSHEIRSAFSHAIHKSNVGELPQFWSELIGKHSEWLDEKIRVEGQRASVRRNLAWTFQDNMLRDIINIIERANSEFIYTIVTTEHISTETQSHSQLSANSIKSLKWEFTLTYLLVERGGEFNKKTYLLSLVNKMAARENTSALALLGIIENSLASVENPSKIIREILATLQGLRSYLSPDAVPVSLESIGDKKDAWAWTVTEGEPGGQIAKTKARSPTGEVHQIELVRGYLLYEDLVELMLEAKVGPAKAIRKIIRLLHEIIDSFPWKLHRFNQEVRAGRISLLAIYRYLPKRLQKKLLHEFVRNFAGDYNFSIIEFDRKIEHLDQTASQETITYETLLRRLLKNQLSDIDSLFQLIETEEEDDTHEGSSAYTKVSNGKRFSTLADPRSYLEFELDDSKASRSQKNESPDSSKYSLELEEADKTSRNIIRLLLEVIENFPWKLYRFNQEVRAGRIPLLAIYKFLPKRLQKKLLHEFVRKFASDYNFSAIEFDRKLEHLGQTAAQETITYGALLGRLLKNQSRDIDSLFQSIGTGEKIGTLGESSAYIKRSNGNRSSGLSDQESYSELGQSNSKASKSQKNQSPDSSKYYRELEEAGVTLKESSKIFKDAMSRLQPFEFEQENPRRIEESNKSLSLERAGKFNRKNENRSEDEAKDTSLPLAMSANTLNLLNAYLLGHLTIGRQESLTVASTIKFLLNNQPSTLNEILNEALLNPAAVVRLTDILPESALLKILLLIEPADYYQTVLYADLLTMACVEHTDAFKVSENLLHQLKWQFIFRYLLIERRAFNEIVFIRQYYAYLEQRVNVSERETIRARLSTGVMSATTADTHATRVRIAMILSNAVASQENTSAGVSGREETQNQDGSRIRYGTDNPKIQSSGMARKKEEDILREREEHLPYIPSPIDDDLEIKEEVHIQNAGLVLIATYLPRYFSNLKLTSGQEFIDRRSSERGVHLLQYIVSESTNRPEYELVLNKLLCGVKPGIPIVRDIDITEEEINLSETLLKSVLSNWPSLKNTSIAGLRESFLHREAKLQLQDESWKLIVQSKAFDMLLDGLPWSYSTIKLPWMDRPIYVDWR